MLEISPEEKKLIIDLVRLYGATYAIMKAVDLGLVIEERVHRIKERQDKRQKTNEDTTPRTK